MKKLVAALSALVLALGGCAAAPGYGFLSTGKQSKPVKGDSTSAAPVVPPIRMVSRRYVLANGLRLVVHRDPRAPVVALAVWYHVGSKDETTGEHGFARLFGRLMLYGFKSSIGGGIHPLEVAGATHIGVRVTRDATEFHETLPRSALDLGLWIEAQRMRHHHDNVNWAGLDGERQAMVHTLMGQGRHSYGRVPVTIAQMAYPAGHPYSWTPAGSVVDLSGATRENAKDWIDRYFNPANATLVVAGDVEPATVKALAERYFDGLPEGERAGHLTRWVARLHGGRRRTVVEMAPRPRLYMVWNVPPAFTPDVARLQLAAAILAAGNNSLLDRRLVDRDQLATGVSAIVRQREIGSQFVVTIDLKPDVSAALVERDADQVIAQLLADGPSSGALVRARSILLAHIVRRLQSASAQAHWLARSEVFAGSPDAWKRQVAVLRSSDAAEVRDAAAEWLSGGVLGLYVIPKSERPSSGIHLTEPSAPVVGPPGKVHIPRLQAMALSNGMVVLLAQRDTAPLVDFDLVIGGGLASDTGVTDGTARLAFESLASGASGGLDVEGGQLLERLGASLSTRVGPDAADLHLSALRLHLADSLAVFARIVKHPTFSKTGIAQGKQRLLAAIATQRQSLAGILHRVLTPLLFGSNHPYAHAGLGRAGLIQSIGQGDLTAYTSRWVRPDNATLLVTGDIALSTLAPMIRADFGGWRASPIPLTRLQIPRVPLPNTAQVYLVNKSGSSQSVVVAANVAPAPAEVDEPAFQVARAALCNGLTSALGMHNVAVSTRESGVFCGLRAAARQQVFYAGVRIPTGQTAAEMRALEKQLNTAASLSGESIHVAKQAVALRLPARLQTVGGLAVRYLRMLTLGLPQNSTHHPVWTIENLTPEQVQLAAKRLLHPAKLTWIVVGDLAKVESSVRALGLGPVYLVNRNGNATAPGQ